VGPRFRRTVVAGALGAAGISACSTDPPSGIRVTLALENPDSESWDAVFADHISVIAEGSDGRRGVACLYPRSTGLASEATEAGGDDPCAGRHPSAPRLSSLGSSGSLNDDWALASREGVNVLAPSGTFVRVRAVAAWGGAALLHRSLTVEAASTSLDATTNFPELRLTFRPNPRKFVEDCPGLDLSRDAIGNRGQAVDFPPAGCSRRAPGPARHEGVIAMGDGTLRVPSDLKAVCGETDEVVVWKTGPLTIDPPSGSGTMCGQLTMEANFATCAAGSKPGVDCTLSVQCTPPPTQFVLLAADGTFLAHTDQDMGCLPSSSGPFTFVTEFAPVDAQPVAAAIEQLAPGGANGCFLDVKRFAFASVPCGN
jgi:hypothetical protein